MRRSLPSVCALLLVAGCGAGLKASTVPAPSLGERVLVVVRAAPESGDESQVTMEGILAGVDGDSLHLRYTDGVTRGVPRAAVTALRVRRGRERGRPAVVGSLVGDFVGWLGCRKVPSGDCSGAPFLALIGAGIGALIGQPGWRDAPLPR